MNTENGRGRQRRRRHVLLLRAEDSEGESGCSGRLENELLHNQPIPNDNEAPSTTTACTTSIITTTTMTAATTTTTTTMTTNMTTNERRSRRRSIRRSSNSSSISIKESAPVLVPVPQNDLSLSSLLLSFCSSTTSTLLSLSWRHMYYVVFAICWLASGALAAPSIARSEELQQHPALEILDGYVNYSIANASSSFEEMSRNAFLSLKGTPVEARFRLGTAYQLESGERQNANHVTNVEHQAHVDHLTRHHRKKNRKPVGKLKKIETDEHGDRVLDGRKHALLQLADPDALNMNQRCDGQKFKQRIRVDGCLTKVVVNRLCHGTCASIFIPRMHSKKLKAAFRSCAACAPAEYDYVDITLDCPGRNPPTATKTIVKVKSCKCREVRISPL
uniref:Bursicon n=1 Tax=Caenorhabditis japonica TaxID=281687 RepID=A0A8R1DU14_CAEJA